MVRSSKVRKKQNTTVIYSLHKKQGTYYFSSGKSLLGFREGSDMFVILPSSGKMVKSDSLMLKAIEPKLIFRKRSRLKAYTP